MTPCSRCGAPLPAEARFCPSCGLALEARAAREERRIVTILFADLVEFTAMSETRDPEDVKRIIDRAFEGLAETVTVYGGRVDKILGDEIMAVFGAPQAHEDDPERAVRCALEMQRSLAAYSEQLRAERDLTLLMRMGVNTGEVVAGAIGGGDAYTVVGDAVNVASRLVKAAEPGCILVGPATRAATENTIDYRDLPPLSVKGKAEAVAASQVAGERARGGPARGRRSTPLVGRDPELALLEATAEIVARDGKPAAVTILGDAGMGKSRLVAEFVARLRDARVLWGRSLPYGTASPAYAVEEMVRSLFDIGPADDPASARRAIADGLAAHGLASETDRIVALAGLREQPAAAGRRAVATAAGPAAQSGPARGGEMAAALTVFEWLALRNRLLVLVFQELHWAEQTLVDLIGDLVDGVRDAPLLVVALGRPELAERTQAWTPRPGSAVLHLLPLSRDASAELLDALAGDRPVHPSVRENVLDRAGGNPFFIEEFVRLLTERGASAPGAATVPVSVQGLVAARLDALEPAVKAVVQDAAVVGESFWPDAIEAIEPRGDGGLAGAIADLVERDLVVAAEHQVIPGRVEYRFAQTIVREVAYAALPKQARAAKHAAVGAWLEDVTCACALEREFYDLVAHHFERAATSAREVGIDAAAYDTKAREYLERAGDEAAGKDAASAAAGFYQRALAFARDDLDALHLRVHLGEAFVGSWHPQKAEAALETALEAARRLGERRLEGKTLRLLGDLARIRGDFDAARTHLERGLALAREAGDALEEVEGLRSHGLLDMFTGRVPAAPLWFRQALARSRDLGDRRGEGWSLQNLGWANLLLGRLDEAVAALDEGAGVFQSIGDLEGVGWCIGLRSWALLFEGKIDEADLLASQLIELAAAAEDNPGGVGGMGIEVERVLRAIVAAYKMRFADAIAAASAALPRFEQIESHWGLAMARFPMALAQAYRLETDAARATLADAAQMADESGDPLVQGLIGATRAYVEVEAGDLDAAAAFAADAFDRTERGGVGWQNTMMTRWLRAEIARRRGDLGAARALLEDPSPVPAGGIFPRNRLARLHAEVLCDEGEPKRAVEVARAAVAESRDATGDAAGARRTLARALLESGDADAAAAEIDATLAALDAGEWDAERVRALALKARILDEQGRHDEAAEVHDRARALLAAFPSEADTAPLAALLG